MNASVVSLKFGFVRLGGFLSFLSCYFSSILVVCHMLGGFVTLRYESSLVLS